MTRKGFKTPQEILKILKLSLVLIVFFFRLVSVRNKKNPATSSVTPLTENSRLSSRNLKLVLLYLCPSVLAVNHRSNLLEFLISRCGFP